MRLDANHLRAMSLMELYHKLYAHYGPQRWWPARTPFEVIVGAILTQAVSWRNVERAISNLQGAGLLDPAALHRVAAERLAALIRPAGYYRAKARKLKAFASHLVVHYGGSLERMFQRPLQELRPELLGIYGIGPETADSILLYAGGYPVFVIDSYTLRVMARLGLLPSNVPYARAQEFFMKGLPHDAALFNEYHALFDAHAKMACTARNPRCNTCPLHQDCAQSAARNAVG